MLPAVFVLSVGLWIDPTTPKLLTVCVFAILVAIVSFIDDLDTIGKTLIKLPPLARLAFQVFVGLVIGFTSIKIGYVSGLLGGIIHLDAYSFSLF